MRQREEDHVVAAEGVEAGLVEHPVGQRDQVRLEATEWLAGVRRAGERADLDLGVREQQPQQLASGVPAGSGDRDPLRGHVHDYTEARMFM